MRSWKEENLIEFKESNSQSNNLYVCQFTFKNGWLDVQTGKLYVFNSVADIKKAWESEPNSCGVLKVAKAAPNGKLGVFKTLKFNDQGDLCNTKEVRTPDQRGIERILKDVVYSRED